ncbi:Hpt domain-containing protein [Piscinibacter defluvii]|uniref:Hpt domain-containing protein n=1 Tax=Piscinibacter defluvii TaxID=1796922 RepID=UPI000FDE445E|nr:Hpt domain-containing protein [Piscinibacter defluvii]
MLLRLSRTLFWVAAVSAAAALAGPEHAATGLTAVAGLALIGSFACWRMAAAQRRADHAADDPIAARSLDRDGLLEAAELAGRAVAAAGSFDAALLAALDVLRAELGCRVAVAHRVLALEPPLARLVTLIDAGPGGRGVEHRVRLEHEPLGTALRDGRAAGRDGGPFALPVVFDGTPLAVLQLAEPALAADRDAMVALLDQLGQQLAAAARSELAPRAELPPSPPPAASPGLAAPGAAVTSSLVPGRVPSVPGAGTTPDVGDNTCDPDAHDEMLRPLIPPDAPQPSADVPDAGLPAGTGRVLDAAALDKLRELDPRGDNRLIQRVMQAFETSVARLLPQLREAERSGDPGGIRHVVHTLKASSASIGALLLSQQCAEIENRIRVGESDGLEPRLASVYAEIDKVLKAVRAWTETP